MRKPIFPRIFLIALLYAGIFVLLVSVQFADHRGFSIKVGDFIVSGQLGAHVGDSDEYFLEGNVYVAFGGLDFDLSGGSGVRSLNFVGVDGSINEMSPEYMIVSENSAQFVFPGGTELVFASFSAGVLPEIRIAAAFAEDVAGLELPFRPQRRTRLTDAGNGRLLAVAGGQNYSFGNSPMDAERMLLLVNAGGRAVSYRAIPEYRAFSPNDYILAQAETASAYNRFIAGWRDTNYPVWNRALTSEDTVVAHIAEALDRGTRTAVPASFSSRTYRSSVFLGTLDQAYVSLVAAENEKLSTLGRQITGGSPDFLSEPNVLDYLATRGQNSLIDAASNVVRGLNPNTLSLEIIPGVFEGYLDWNNIRAGTVNPFAPLTAEAYIHIADSLRKTANTQEYQGSLSELVYVVYEGRGEAEFNLRLGMALMRYAESERDDQWAGIGRSLVLSALSMGEVSGPELSARLYNILRPTDFYPRTVTAGSPPTLVWTASNEVTSVQQTDVLTISARFPVGESHYMLIRGVRPFVRLQLYDIDYRTDPQFERWDSSGWHYMAQEQTLLVKMRHRADVENIRIIFREAPRPVVAPPPPPLPPAQVDPDDDSGITSGPESTTENTGGFFYYQP